ncbi:MAG: hypothetical protein GYA17_05170 [Chloroflexi bacterium]|jgi:hypothetical protein|nr:hypothetical protein [Anaerolineaceae bacterium]NMB87726.1 hypothetical protein [Chloroflexota bacterium]
MNVSQHPEYDHYLETKRKANPYFTAVEAWRNSGKTISVPEYNLEWNVDSAQDFILKLAGLFQKYNQVIWDDFHFCRVCQGRCCVQGASSVEPFDWLALALVNEPFPVLPPDHPAEEKRCIYLQDQRCSWPENWRTFRCWTYYCLGPMHVIQKVCGKRDPGECYAELAGALAQCVLAYLPMELRQFEMKKRISFSKKVDSPTAFAYAINEAVTDLLLHPFELAYL